MIIGRPTPTSDHLFNLCILFELKIIRFCRRKTERQMLRVCCTIWNSHSSNHLSNIHNSNIRSSNSNSRSSSQRRRSARSEGRPTGRRRRPTTPTGGRTPPTSPARCDDENDACTGIAPGPNLVGHIGQNCLLVVVICERDV